MNHKDSVYHYEGLLQSGRWFGSLPEKLRKTLLNSATVVQLSAGQMLFSQDDPLQGIYAVLSGGISIGRHREDGKEALLTLIDPPNWFGEITLFDRMNRTHHAYAVSDTILLHIAGNTLDQILEKEPRYWQNFGQLLTEKLRILLDQAEDLALRSTAQRLAKRLVLFADNYGNWKDRSRRTINIPQEQLAMMLFITRQTTNQILKDLERQGLIKLVYGAIEIIDFEGLRLFADTSSEAK
ncbi:MAG: Crp/Fnr family transcriptional regulator [Gammaproteobacteria bacterium]|nr:Crp/Fnr family transcriptional regulator [Gammaproteobacteria bacterium]